MSWENTVAAKLSPHDDRPTYECCGQGKLELIDERPDPIFGVLGMTCQMLNWAFLECGQLECGSDPTADVPAGRGPHWVCFPGVGLFCVRAGSIRPLLMLLAYAVERDWLSRQTTRRTASASLMRGTCGPLGS
jgi:hypothetical protein